jgi:sec-independent protein translocase protein TatB
MFDIGWSEMLVIGVVALIVIGPKELPGVLRALGHWTTKIRRMAGEFQSQFQEAMREAEMADLKKQVDDLNDPARNLTTKFDPLDYTDPAKWQASTPSSEPSVETPPAAPSSPETPPVAAPAPETPPIASPAAETASAAPQPAETAKPPDGGRPA